MGRENYMKPFVYQHNLAFGEGAANHGLHTDEGAPEDGSGLGWYSQNRLSYKEWHRLACIRQSLNEQITSNPVVIFNMFLGGFSYPEMAAVAGSMYLLSTFSRARSLRKDNGVHVARKSISGLV